MHMGQRGGRKTQDLAVSTDMYNLWEILPLGIGLPSPVPRRKTRNQDITLVFSASAYVSQHDRRSQSPLQCGSGFGLCSFFPGSQTERSPK